jgi:NAD(P)-dependent dehydrogenase (short-subunit alcohol dehydrogenase family)
MAILVSGGAGGIGRAVARVLADRGTTPVIADVALESAEQTAAAIDGASAMGLDVTDPDACDHAVAEVIARHGRIDGVVCCAAVFVSGGALDTTPEALDRTLKVNVHGTLFLCQAAARAMIEAGDGGSLVLFSSGAASRAIGSPNGSPAYSASKGAVEALTRELALAWAPHRIRVNAVAPGVIDTEMSSIAQDDPQTLQRLMAHTPLGSMGMPEEVAETVAFLLSDAASYVTASVIPTDGGFLSV